MITVYIHRTFEQCRLCPKPDISIRVHPMTAPTAPKTAGGTAQGNHPQFEDRTAQERLGASRGAPDFYTLINKARGCKKA